MATTWYAQGAGNFDAFTSFKSTIWNDVANGSGNWMGDGVDDTFASYNAANQVDTFRGKAATAVAINCNVTAAQIDASGNTGTFTIGADVTLNANLVAGNAATFLINANTPTVNITGTTAAGVASCITISVTGVLNVTGSVTGGSASNARCIAITAAATVTVNGNVLGGSSSGAVGIYSTSSTAVITINGNCTASSSASGASNNGGNYPVTVTGNVVDHASFSASGMMSLIWAPAAATNFRTIRTSGATTITAYYDVPTAANVRETDTVAGVTGTVLTKTLSAANETVDAGYYAATTLSAVDADLAAANIVSGTTIFGFAGAASAGGGLIRHPGMDGGLNG